jgi:ATP-dependent Clp protease ATP-binding subunit ClpA
MERKMQEEIKELIEMKLDQVEHDEHVTDNLFCAIEKDPDALALYRDLCDEYGKRAINQGIGKALKEILAREVGGSSSASSNLIKSYTLLVPVRK